MVCHFMLSFSLQLCSLMPVSVPLYQSDAGRQGWSAREQGHTCTSSTINWILKLLLDFPLLPVDCRSCASLVFLAPEKIHGHSPVFCFPVFSMCLQFASEFCFLVISSFFLFFDFTINCFIRFCAWVPASLNQTATASWLRHINYEQTIQNIRKIKK